MQLVKLDKVYYNYITKDGVMEAVNNLSFTIDDGEFVAIIGPSGCGKSTILSLISGLIKESGGKILRNGDIPFGYMLQRDCLFPWRTIYKNSILALEVEKKLNEISQNYVNSLLKKYDLYSFKDLYPSSLSGGMRQRVALIRTLATKPKLLLLDEPTSSLDYQTRLEVTNDLYNIIRNENKTAVLVTHDISEAISVADKIIVLSKRPATLIAKHELTTLKELPPLTRRENKNFPLLFEKIWGEIER